MLQALDPQPDAQTAAKVQPASLKDALARLASGVAVIACWDDGAPKGLIATSLSGLSLDPPLLLFSVRHEASAHDALLREGRYTATILSQADAVEAQAFATTSGSISRFTSPKWRLGDPFAPRFTGGLASFDLRTDRWIRTHATTIFIAEAQAVNSTNGAPLLYYDRTFAALSSAGA